ncbi:MAG: HPr family phosphocarrier protein [Oligosphaeraceae bacterium]|nr:HPr family phosphocarrier protein [Oligosphaeraceae bacterium]
MTSKTVTIQNPHGIHVRPATLIVKAAQGYPGTITVCRPGETEINLNSALALMALALRLGDTVTVCVNGPDEKQKCNEISELIASKFDFPDT